MVKKKSSLEAKNPLGYWLSPEEKSELDENVKLEEMERDRKALSDIQEKKLNKSLGARLLKGAITSSKVLDKKTPTFRKTKFVRPNISQHQQLLREMFGGSERTWGTGTCLPKLHRTLTRGNGLIKSGDNARETASMFGFG